MYLFISVGEHRVPLLALMAEDPQPKLTPQGGGKLSASGGAYRIRHFQSEGGMLDVMDLGCYHPDPWSQEALCGCHLGDLSTHAV